MTIPRNASTAVLLLGLILACRGKADDATNQPRAVLERSGALAPRDELASFQIAPGLRIELAACEPEVIDPVAIRFDEQGRMWVVEMRDYPHGPAQGEAPKSRIKVLEDRDHDGRFETSRVFAEQLLFATGIQPWKGGVFVTMAGEVAYLRDKDGDGRADERETWFTGFATENSQLRANHPTLALDNKVYVANGLRGGTVVDARGADAEPVSISGMDFCFDPLTGRYDAATGVGQFGLTFDDFGNRFVCSNRNPLIHIVLQNDALRRNPRAAIRAASGDVARSGEESRIFPISRAWTTSNLHAGQFTAACGVTIYRGDALPAELRGNAFTCDPTGNLVHREVVRPEGMSFVSSPGREGVEFLASTDEWFRPVNLQNGPDGALYVVDMYRAVIEHPQFMPDELKSRPDLLDGADRGRIWRIVAEGGTADRQIVDLGKCSSAELVALFERFNGWHRDTASRLLLERRDPRCAEALATMARDGQTNFARIHAYAVLDGIGELSEELVRDALRDPDPRVRERGIDLWEQRFRDNAALRREVVALHADSDARLRGRVAVAIAPINDDPDEISALAEIARRADSDVWTIRAVVLSVGEHADQILSAVLRERSDDPRPELVAELAASGASQDDADKRSRTLVALLTGLPDQHHLVAPALLRFSQALSRGESLARIRNSISDTDKATLDNLFAEAERLVADPKADDSSRITAIQLLVYSPIPSDVVPRLAASGDSQSVRVAAINALGRLASDDAWPLLLARFPLESPAIRRAVIDGSLSRTSRTRLLLDELAAGRVKPAELERTQASRLLNHGDAAIRDLATKLFADAIPADRQQVLADYQSVLNMAADASRGKQVFQKNCATCHRVGDVGVNVAPDISDTRTKQPSQLLADILQPNRAIDNNYISYVVLTTDGRTLTGVISAETATSVSIRQPEDKTVTLLRSEIEEMRSTGLSLMPEGLEKNISKAEMADLISYLKNWRYLDGLTPLSSSGGQ